MTYEETLEFLFKQLPMYQRQGKSAYKKDLSNTITICDALGNPERNFKSIHIAGTNGKGSTAHMLASIFQEAGYKTGLYTSPHLKDFRERVRINGEMITKNEVLSFVESYQAKFSDIQPSFFEWSVGLAFYYFDKKEVDIAIIETGLGGRLDSTNVIKPELNLITNIGLDHTDMLGETLEEIAGEKAGIIKEKTPVVISNASKQENVFKSKAHQMNAPIYFANELKTNLSPKTDLLGLYQAENIKGALQAWVLLRKMGWKISVAQLERGLLNVAKNTNLRGRWEALQNKPLIIAETAHNEEGLSIALNQVEKIKKDKTHFVLGFVKDKKLNSILQLFPKDAAYYFCQANVPRALDVLELKNAANELGLQGEMYSSVQAAFNAAKAEANSDDMIYVGGSNFVVAEAI